LVEECEKWKRNCCRLGWKEKEGTWGMLYHKREIDLKKNVLSVVAMGREKFLECTKIPLAPHVPGLIIYMKRILEPYYFSI
jgi:hypothetical protein